MNTNTKDRATKLYKKAYSKFKAVHKIYFDDQTEKNLEHLTHAYKRLGCIRGLVTYHYGVDVDRIHNEYI